MATFIANDMRVGWVIAHNGKRYSVTSITKVKPGKGGAFVQADYAILILVIKEMIGGARKIKLKN